jgi:Pyrimidine dimer DNA glycosylase
MRLWTVHPKYLDAKGLVALWREGLLAKAVLEGKTEGYRHHPQLQRFREHRQALPFLCEYLRAVLIEAETRGYAFDAAKLPRRKAAVAALPESRGQLEYEWRHLLAKLERRDPERFERLAPLKRPRPHPLFRIVRGEVKSWEVVS